MITDIEEYFDDEDIEMLGIHTDYDKTATDDTPEALHLDPDDRHLGDILTETKPPDTVRLYCINLNGLKWDQDGGNWPDICQAMEACHIDIVGLAN